MVKSQEAVFVALNHLEEVVVIICVISGVYVVGHRVLGFGIVILGNWLT